MTRRFAAALACCLALAACEPADNEPGPGGVTVGEARALDEAAEMIEQRRLPDGALENPDPEPVELPPSQAAPETTPPVQN